MKIAIIGAGLGGGSSDAAGMLKILNNICKTKLSSKPFILAIQRNISYASSADISKNSLFLSLPFILSLARKEGFNLSIRKILNKCKEFSSKFLGFPIQ